MGPRNSDSKNQEKHSFDLKVWQGWGRGVNKVGKKPDVIIGCSRSCDANVLKYFRLALLKIKLKVNLVVASARCVLISKGHVSKNILEDVPTLFDCLKFASLKLEQSAQVRAFCDRHKLCWPVLTVNSSLLHSRLKSSLSSTWLRTNETSLKREYWRSSRLNFYTHEPLSEICSKKYCRLTLRSGLAISASSNFKLLRQIWKTCKNCFVLSQLLLKITSKASEK